MKRRAFLGTALVGLPITGAFAAQPKSKGGDIPTTTLGKTGIEVQIIAQGGARMDLHPDIPSAAKHVRDAYELGLRYFDCARMYWNGQSEEAGRRPVANISAVRAAVESPSMSDALAVDGAARREPRLSSLDLFL